MRGTTSIPPAGDESYPLGPPTVSTPCQRVLLTSRPRPRSRPRRRPDRRPARPPVLRKRRLRHLPPGGLLRPRVAPRPGPRRRRDGPLGAGAQERHRTPSRSHSALADVVLGDRAGDYERAIFPVGAPAETEDEIGRVTGVATTDALRAELDQCGIDTAERRPDRRCDGGAGERVLPRRRPGDRPRREGPALPARSCGGAGAHRRRAGTARLLRRRHHAAQAARGGHRGRDGTDGPADAGDDRPRGRR